MEVVPAREPEDGWWRPAAALTPAALRWGLRGRGPDGLDLRPGAPEAVWAGLADGLGCAGWPVARVSQVHGDGLLEATTGGVIGEADALYTTTSGLLLCVRVADCVPVLLAGPQVVAAVHAGWRGAAAGIVPKVVAQLRGEGLSVDRAWIGPSICGPCYEVGDEVVDAIEATGVPTARFVQRRLGARPHADVGAAVYAQLEASGVPLVARDPACSRCAPGLHSYRRDGARSGRMGAVIGLAPASGATT